MEIFIVRDGRQVGPFSAEKIRDLIQHKEVGPDDFVWHEPMVDWQPAHRVFDFSEEYRVSPSPISTGSSSAFPSSNRENTPTGNAEQHTPAGRFSRLIAALIDSAVLFAALLPAFLLAGLGVGMDNKGLIAAGSLAGFVAILGLLVYQTKLLLSRGMTIGKRMISVRIVSSDGDAPGFGRIVGLRIMVPAFIGSVPLLGPIFSLLDALFIFREDKKCIHDHLAGTNVVSVETSASRTW